MIELKDITNIYFVGIGGIGMSAIARYFVSRGVVVSGYDKTQTVLTAKLADEGMHIHYTDDVNLVDKKAQLVVYTPAIPKDHAELNWYRDNGYEVVKRSDVLQIITKDAFSICVAGTHGKTSISTMIGHILRHSGYGCNAFLGGISVNYNSNFWSSHNHVCVVEADEYDRSFLKLSPDVAIVTAMDADHLDIYGTVEAMEEAFVQFAGKIKSNGLLIRKQSLTKLNEAQVRRQLTYQLSAATHEAETCADPDHHHEHETDEPDVFAENIRTQSGSYIFDASISGAVIKDVVLNMGGLHNIENVLSAITVARALAISDEKIKAAVADFKGVKRRFEYTIRHLPQAAGAKQLVMVDDYAHHPEELKALISSARGLFPDMKCKVVFQPHLFSRTRDLAHGFAEALDLAGEVILLPIYPARELPMEGVTSALISQQMKQASVQLLSRDEAYDLIDADNTELLIMAGAGDIDTLIPKLAEKLKTKLI